MFWVVDSRVSKCHARAANCPQPPSQHAAIQPASRHSQPPTAACLLPAMPCGRDVRWVTEAVNGITRWRRRLDYILGALLNRDPATLDAPLRQILRLGLYELAEMRCECCAVRRAVQLYAVHAEGCAKAVLPLTACCSRYCSVYCPMYCCPGAHHE